SGWRSYRALGGAAQGTSTARRRLPPIHTGAVRMAGFIAMCRKPSTCCARHLMPAPLPAEISSEHFPEITAGTASPRHRVSWPDALVGVKEATVDLMRAPDG